MVDRKALLEDLQKLLRKLEQDLLERSDPESGGEAFHQALRKTDRPPTPPST